MGTKTIGKVVFGVISVTLAFFTLSLGIFHYMQHSSAERFNNTMIVYKTFLKKDEADILFILKKKQKKGISAFLLIKQNLPFLVI